MKKILMLTLVAWLVACAGPSVPVLPPDEILGGSAEAVSTMTTAQFFLFREGTAVALDSKKQLYFVGGKGAYQAPDRVVAVVQVRTWDDPKSVQPWTSLDPQTIRMSWLPTGNYVSGPEGENRGRMSADVKLDCRAMFGPNGLSRVMKVGIQNVKFVGMETETNSKMYHLRGEANGADLAPLTVGSLTPGTVYPVELWIEAKTINYIRLKIFESNDNGWLLSLFDINKPLGNVPEFK